MISSNPNPASGAAADIPRSQAGATDQPGSPRRVVPLISGTEGRSSFSQVLTGEMALARSGGSDTEDKKYLEAPPKEGRSENRAIHDEDPSTRYETTAPNDKGQGAVTASPGNEPPVQPDNWNVGMAAGALPSWGGWANMIPMGASLGLANTAVAGIIPTGGLPPQVVAGLAADIVSGYSEQNGVQTLTVNLEPDHLGPVEVRLLAKGDHLSVRLLAANPEAESALRENLKDLTDAIQVRTGRYQQMEVKVALRESHDPDQEPGEKENPDFHRQGSPDEQSPEAETEKESSGNSRSNVATEPDHWAQEG